MTERDPSQWRRGGEPPEGDSIAGRLASRIDAVPPSPGDAMDWAAVAARYEREATSLGETPGAAELLFEAGRVYEERLVDPQAALGFYRRAFAAGPHFVPNLRALARLGDERGDEALAAEVRSPEVALPRGPGAAPAAGAAAPAPAGAQPAVPAPARPIALALASAQVAATARDGAALLEACERCAEAAEGEDGRRSAHHLLAGSAVAEGTGALERAAALALRAFERCPDDPLVRSAARLHAARGRDLVHLAEVLRADARAAPGAASARSLLELARVEEQLGHGDQAVASLEEAWTAAPDDPRVLSELARLRGARGEWEAASDALEGLAAAHAAHDGAGHRHEAVAARLRRMELEEMVLQRVEEAARSCREVLAMEPGNRTALASLGRLAARTGDWDAAVATYRAEAEAARDPTERAQRTFKAAQLLEERLGRVPEAVEAYRAALAQDPLLLAARSALERLLEREGRWDDLRRLLEDDLGPGATPAEEVETLFRLARLEEDRLGDAAAAAARLHRILELEPENAGALRQLHQSLERSGSAAELAAVLQEEARLATSPRRRRALLERRAEVLEDLLQDPGRAAEAWEELRAAFPDDPAALRALGRLHAAAGHWEQVVATFRSQAELTPDPVQAAELLLRAADLEERRLSRPDQAVRLYREALTLQPSHFPALVALSRLYRTQDEPEPLAEVLVELATTREEPGERAAALVELGQLCEERLADPGRALEAYGEALQADPRHLPALRASERLLLALGRTDELAALRRAALDDEDAGDRTERLLRLAWQELARPGDQAEAQRVAGAVVAAAPDSPSAELLELHLADEPARRARALAALGGEPPAPPAPPPAPSPEAADAAPAPAGDAATTSAPGEAPAASEPQPPARSPAEVADRAHPGDPAELARLSEARLAAASDPGSRAAWAVQAGEAWERAGELGRALAAYQAALSAAPAHLPALRAARNVFARQRDWGAVRATLQAEGETLTDGHEAAAAWREAGAIAEQWFGDVEGAVEDYRAALQRDPGDPVALTRVEALLAPSGLAELAEVHAARARADQDPHRAAEAWLAAARSSLSRPDGRKAALTHLDEALQRHPDHAAALELRARLRAQAGQPSLALDDLERCLALGGEPPTQLPLRLAAAALCEEKLQDDAAALRHTEAALALVPESTEALARLAHLHRTAARLPASAAALQRLLAVPDLPREAQVEHGFALASAQAELGQPEAGLASCRRVLDLDPGHPGARGEEAIRGRRPRRPRPPPAHARSSSGPRRSSTPRGPSAAAGAVAPRSSSTCGPRSSSTPDATTSVRPWPSSRRRRSPGWRSTSTGACWPATRPASRAGPPSSGSTPAAARTTGRSSPPRCCAGWARRSRDPAPTTSSWRAIARTSRPPRRWRRPTSTCSAPPAIAAPSPIWWRSPATRSPPPWSIPGRRAGRRCGATTPSAASSTSSAARSAPVTTSSTPRRWGASPSSRGRLRRCGWGRTSPAAPPCASSASSWGGRRRACGPAARWRRHFPTTWPTRWVLPSGWSCRATWGWASSGRTSRGGSSGPCRARPAARWTSRPAPSPASGRRPTSPPGAPRPRPRPTAPAWSCAATCRPRSTCSCATAPGASPPPATALPPSTPTPRPGRCSASPPPRSTSRSARSSGWRSPDGPEPERGPDLPYGPSLRSTHSRGSAARRAASAACTWAASRDSTVSLTR
jgi:tetratricopeptide (TPR) repeat protein